VIRILFFAGFLGIVLLLGSIPSSISNPEVLPFANPNAVIHMSSTAIDILDNLPEPKSENERMKKFDIGFYDKINSKINLQNEETEYYTIIVFLKNDDPDVYPKGFAPKSKSFVNKISLANNLEKYHGATDVYVGHTLSFVSAKIPVSEIPVIADYENIFILGDGESPINFQLNISKNVINADNLSFTGTGVKVALLDSGINQLPHDDLPIPNTIINQIFCTNNDCPSSLQDFDDGVTGTGHGTHVAGIIAGQGIADTTKKGIAPGAQLFNVKIPEGDLEGTSNAFAKGMDWAVTNGARVINLSLGINADDDAGMYTIASLIADEAADKGAFVSAAACNNPTSQDDFDVCPPATGVNVLAVGDMDDKNQENPINYEISFRSRIGPLPDTRLKPEVVAPGENIFSPEKTSTNGYADFDGTSASTPHVSGSGAILLDAHPELIPLETKMSLIAGADWRGPSLYTASVHESSPNTDVNEWGFGLIDVTESLNLIDNGKVIKDTKSISETKEYNLSVTNGQQTKVFLSWFKHPGGSVENPIDVSNSNYQLVIKDHNNQTVIDSLSNFQNPEFVVFTPTVTSSQWKIQVSTSTQVKNIETFVVASTHPISIIAPLGCIPDDLEAYDWIVTKDCTLSKTSTAFHNVIIDNNARLIIPNGLTLDIDFTNNHLLIKSGSSVLIENGGKIT